MNELLNEAKQAVSEANHIEWANRKRRTVSEKAVRMEATAFNKAKRLISEYVAAGGSREDILG